MNSPLDVHETEMKVSVSNFHDNIRVDIRKWYQDSKTGEWKRTGKGLNIILEDFEHLYNQIDDINEYVKEETERLNEEIKEGKNDNTKNIL